MKRKANNRCILPVKYMNCERSRVANKTHLKINDRETNFAFEFPDGEVMRVHKEVLKKNDVFRAAVESDMEESRHMRWQVDAEESRGMRDLLVFLYTQELDITPENMCDLFLIATKYNEHAMAAQCAESMLTMMNENNCVAVWYLLSQSNFWYAESADIAMEAFASRGTPRVLLREKDEVIAYYMRRRMVSEPREAMALIHGLDTSHDKSWLTEKYLRSTDPVHIFTIDIKDPGNESVCSSVYENIEMLGRLWDVELEYSFSEDVFSLYLKSKEYIPSDMTMRIDTEISCGPTQTLFLFEVEDTRFYYGDNLNDISLVRIKEHTHSVALTVNIRSLTMVSKKK
jgi:hypothetical protein